MHANGASKDDILGALRIRHAHREDGEYKVLKAWALLKAWQYYWEEWDWEWIAVEEEIQAPLINPNTGAASPKHSLTGIVDKIAKDHQGNLWLVDHKIVGSASSVDANSDYVKRMIIDSQPSTYVYLARQAGYDVRGFYYDLVREPSIRPRTIAKDEIQQMADIRLYHGLTVDAETQQWAQAQVIKPKKDWEKRTETPELYAARCINHMLGDGALYFARHLVSRTKSDIEDWANDTWGAKKMLDYCQVSGHYPRNTNSCLFPYRCEFADICLNGRTAKDLPEGYYIKESDDHGDTVQQSASTTTSEA